MKRFEFGYDQIEGEFYVFDRKYSAIYSASPDAKPFKAAIAFAHEAYVYLRLAAYKALHRRKARVTPEIAEHFDQWTAEIDQSNE